MKRLILPVIILACLVTLPAQAQKTTPTPPAANSPVALFLEAAGKGKVEIVQLHLANGVNVNAKDEYGQTALIYAAKNGHKNVAELLLKNGADVNVQEEFGLTPLMCAAYNGKISVAKLLIEKGADIHVKDNDGRTAAEWARVTNHPETANVIEETYQKIQEEKMKVTTEQIRKAFSSKK